VLSFGQEVEYVKYYKGTASVYSDNLRGHTMANGQPYIPEAFTCATLLYPLGTLLWVYHNGSQTEVIVADRGPFVKGRIIDLSKAAAEALDLHGIGHVEITEVRAGPVE